MKTVIMAGGKGTRLAPMTHDIPKPMVRICNKPILEYEIDCLIKNDLTDIIIVTGHLGDTIKDYFKDGSAFGCNISYYTEEYPLGTAGAIFKFASGLSDDFILLNGDTIFDIDFSRIIAFHYAKKAMVTLAVHPNNHPFDSALLFTDKNDRVINFLNKEDTRLYYKNQVNAGIHILSKNLFLSNNLQKENIDLDRDILKPLVFSGTIYAYHTPEYISDVGTPERFYKIENDIKNNNISKRNLSQKQKAVFLDRDGTINKSNGFIARPEDLELLDGAAEAIKVINQLGYLAIVITNQPVIARGELSLGDLDTIHNKMETELGKSGAFLDDIFFCPHHPDKGFPGEKTEYKIECNCRKPKPGMILNASEKYNIDLGKSYMVGDDNRDIQAGMNAGCIPVLLTKTQSITIMENVLICENLLDFVNDFLVK